MYVRALACVYNQPTHLPVHTHTQITRFHPLPQRTHLSQTNICQKVSLTSTKSLHQGAKRAITYIICNHYITGASPSPPPLQAAQWAALFPSLYREIYLHFGVSPVFAYSVFLFFLPLIFMGVICLFFSYNFVAFFFYLCSYM